MNREAKLIIKVLLTSVVCSIVLFLTDGTTYLGKWNQIELGDLDNNDKVKEDKLTGSLVVQAFTNGDNSFNAWNKVVYAFEQASGIKVTLLSGSDANTKHSVDWSNGNPPDIVSVDGAGISDFSMLESNMFLPLNDFFKNERIWGDTELIKDKIDNSYFEYYNGKIFEAPFMTMSNGMYTDETYFAEHNLTVPNNYDELIEYSKACKNLGKSAIIYPGRYPSYIVNSFIIPAIAAYGDQEYLDAFNGGKPEAFDLNNPKCQTILKPVLDRFYEYAHMDSNYFAQCLTYDHTQSQSEWYQHEALMIGNGEWLYGEMEATLKDDKNNFKMHYSTSPLILSTQEPTVVSYPRYMGVARQGKNQSNALQFLRFLYRSDIQTILTSNYGFESIRKDFHEFRDSSKYTYIANQTHDLLLNTKKYIKTASNGSVGEILNTQINCLITNDVQFKVDVETAIENVRQEAVRFTSKVSEIGKE